MKKIGFILVYSLIIMLIVLGGCTKPTVTLPDAPQNLEASAGDGEVQLDWTASANATSYKIYQSETAGGPYDAKGTTTENSYKVTDLENGITYYFVVTAVNEDGESEYSSEASATPEAESVVYNVSLYSPDNRTDFGISEVGVGNSSLGFEIFNEGESGIYLTGDPIITITGEGAEHFSLVQPDYNYLPSGQKMSFGITFSPTSSGLKTATIVVKYNQTDVEEGSQSLSLEITGTGNTWFYVGDPEFTPALDIGGRAEGSSDYLTIKDYNGIPYISFKNGEVTGSGIGDYGLGPGKASVMSYDGTSWNYVGNPGVSDEAAFWVSLDIFTDGTLYTAYTDTDFDLGGATVKKFSGTDWELVGAREFTKADEDVEDASNPGNGAYSSIDIYDDNGTPIPYVAVQEKVNGICGAVVYKYTGQGTSGWEVVGTKGFGVTFDPIIQVANENSVPVPYVANVGQGIMKYTEENGWEALGDTLLPNLRSFEIGYEGGTPVPYIAIVDYDYDNKLSVMKFNGTSWE